MKTPLDIKQAADVIGDHLREAGHAVPRNVALELSAKLARFRNLHAAQNAPPASPAATATLPLVRPADGHSNLSRFVDAQSGLLGPLLSDYRQALRELQDGRKETHWIWYVLPQLRGLGFSEMSFRYGIESLEEAKAYLSHPILGARLRECVNALKRHKGTDPERIFGPLDAAKYRSCLTLFKAVAGPESVFVEALDDFYAGKEDGMTIALLALPAAESPGGNYLGHER